MRRRLHRRRGVRGGDHPGQRGEVLVRPGHGHRNIMLAVVAAVLVLLVLILAVRSRRDPA